MCHVMSSILADVMFVYFFFGVRAGDILNGYDGVLLSATVLYCVAKGDPPEIPANKAGENQSTISKTCVC